MAKKPAAHETASKKVLECEKTIISRIAQAIGGFLLFCWGEQLGGRTRLESDVLGFTFCGLVQLNYHRTEDTHEDRTRRRILGVKQVRGGVVVIRGAAIVAHMAVLNACVR